MHEDLSQEEKDLMLELIGDIVTRKELEEYLDCLEEQRHLEEETLRSVIQPC